MGRKGGISYINMRANKSIRSLYGDYKTKLDGVLLIKLESLEDHRGISTVIHYFAYMKTIDDRKERIWK